MIICTIHQPSVEVFYLFDKVLVLGAGECAFNGPITEIDDYFKDALRPKANPADIIVFEVQQRAEHFVAKWNTSTVNPRSKEVNRKRIDDQIWKSQYEPLRTKDVRSGSVETVHYRAESPSFWLQLRMLTLRELMDTLRNRRLAVTRFLQILLFALVTGFLYFKVEQVDD